MPQSIFLYCYVFTYNFLLIKSRIFPIFSSMPLIYWSQFNSSTPYSFVSVCIMYKIKNYIILWTKLIFTRTNQNKSPKRREENCQLCRLRLYCIRENEMEKKEYIFTRSLCIRVMSTFPSHTWDSFGLHSVVVLPSTILHALRSSHVIFSISSFHSIEFGTFVQRTTSAWKKNISQSISKEMQLNLWICTIHTFYGEFHS